MNITPKILILGPPDGPQAKFVSEIAQIKVKSSARASSGNGFIPMQFGRVKLDNDADLQLFGAERDQTLSVIETISEGLVGAILLTDEYDLQDPHFASDALDELIGRRIPTIVGLTSKGITERDIEQGLGIPAGSVQSCIDLSREDIKLMLVAVLEAALRAAEGSTASAG